MSRIESNENIDEHNESSGKESNLQDHTISSSENDATREDDSNAEGPENDDMAIDEAPTTPETDCDSDSEYVPSSSASTSSSSASSPTTTEEILHGDSVGSSPKDRRKEPECVEEATQSIRLSSSNKSDDLTYGKRHRQKDFCFYCETLVQCFARHVMRNHSMEIEVQKILSYPPRNATRKQLFANLRKKGNYLNSCRIQKAVKKSSLKPELLPCTDCLGFYSRKHLWRHRRKYHQSQTSKSTQVDAQNYIIRRLQVDEELKTKVFPRMRPDEISLVAKMDKLICAFGSRYLKIHREAHFINVVSRKMRELARLMIEIKKIDSRISSLFDVLKPNHFDIIVEATKKVAKYDTHKDTFSSPTYALNIGTSLKQCCNIALLYALKKKDIYANIATAEAEAGLRSLIHLIDENWRFEVSNQAGSDLNLKKWNKVTIIPLAADLKLLKTYLIQKGNESARAVQGTSANDNDFRVLVETVFCRVILLNRRRPGELQRLTAATYQDYPSKVQNYAEFEEAITPTEKILMKRFKRLVIRGKRGRGVPILFSTDVQKHIEIIISHRHQFLKHNNQYLFPNLNSSEPICGYKVLKKYATLCGAKNPDGITCTKLRKHLATLSQVFNMTEGDLEQLATFMGHTVGIHRQSYRLPDDVYQTSKIAKILLLLEKGSLVDIKGKTLEEIDVNMEEDLLEENDGEEVEPIESNHSVSGDIQSAQNEANIDSCDLPTTRRNSQHPKKRQLVKWTEEQKNIVISFFSNHIRNKKPPKKEECNALIRQEKTALHNKDWLKIKVFVQNQYSGKYKK